MTVLGAQQGRRGLPGLAPLKKVRDQDAFAVVRLRHGPVSRRNRRQTDRIKSALPLNTCDKQERIEPAARLTRSYDAK
jgi:hypothetical protein